MTTTTHAAVQAPQPAPGSREAFEAALKTKPEARFWNATDAMLWAFQAGAAGARVPSTEGAPEAPTEWIWPAGECHFAEIADNSETPHLRIKMGHGRIEVGDAVHDGLPALWFGNDGQGLGVERDRNDKAKSNETVLIVTFENLAGLEAIEFAAKRVRAKMEAAAPLPAPAEGDAAPAGVIPPVDDDRCCYGGPREACGIPCFRHRAGRPNVQPKGTAPDWRRLVGRMARALDQCADNADPASHPATMREVATRLTGLLTGVEFPDLAAAAQAPAPAPDADNLRRDYARALDTIKGHAAQIVLLEQQARELRAFQAMVNRYAPEFPVDPDAPRDVWYWQGDGRDHLESMVHQLPVVIRAEQLRELLAASQSPASGRQTRLPESQDRTALRQRERAEQASVGARPASAGDALSAKAEPAPNDWRLPADLKSGHVTFRKGVHCSALVSRMDMLHREAFGADSLTPEQKAEPYGSTEMPYGIAPRPRDEVLRLLSWITRNFGNDHPAYGDVERLASLQAPAAKAEPVPGAVWGMYGEEAVCLVQRGSEDERIAKAGGERLYRIAVSHVPVQGSQP